MEEEAIQQYSYSSSCKDSLGNGSVYRCLGQGYLNMSNDSTHLLLHAFFFFEHLMDSYSQWIIVMHLPHQPTVHCRLKD